MERNDPSDLTEGQWRKSRGLWPQVAKRGRKPRERRWVLTALLSVVRTGCPWQALPQDFPKWQPVATVFWRGRQPGVWKRVHDALRVRVRKQGGKKPTPTAAIIESQRVKTTEVGGPERGSEAGQQGKGRKRHIAVDPLGRILAGVGQGAAVQDQEGAKRVYQPLVAEFGRLPVVFGDSAYGRSGLPRGSLSTASSSCKRGCVQWVSQGLWCCPNAGSLNGHSAGWAAAGA